MHSSDRESHTADDLRVRPTWLRYGTVAILLCYWVALAIATHVPSYDTSPPSTVHGDKIAHFVAYAGLAFFISWTSYANFGASRPLRTLLVVLIYGAVDEWLQQFVPTREADGWDLLADAVGASGGLVLAVLSVQCWYWIRRARTFPTTGDSSVEISS